MSHRQKSEFVCEVCGHCPRLGSSVFRLDREDGQTAWHCASCAVSNRALVRRALKTSAVVGTILAVINHGLVYATGPWTTGLWVKTVLTYAVPFGVTYWGALSTNARRLAKTGRWELGTPDGAGTTHDEGRVGKT